MITLAFLHLLFSAATDTVRGWPVEAYAADRSVYVMGTILHGHVESTSRTGAQAALESAIAEVERWDGLLSTWDPTTPLSALNRAPVGASVACPGELSSTLAEAFAWRSRTHGAFDPAVGPLVDAWGLRHSGRRPGAAELADALSRTGPGAFDLDEGSGTVRRLARGAWIDTGGFGKGAALRAAADTLRAHGVVRATLDLGGQILVVGASDPRAPVAVAHPTRRHEPTVWLRLSDVSVATSGNSERGIDVDGARLGHLLDPRTGLPVPYRGSVTVVAADPFEADVLSTALYVMGPELGLAWAELRDDVGVLFLVDSVDGTVGTRSNRAMSRWLAPAIETAGSTPTHSPERRLP